MKSTRANQRVQKTADPGPGEAMCAGSFIQRVHEELSRTSSQVRSLGARTTLIDLLCGFYYRSLQTQYVHVCSLGYCRPSWNCPCRWELPVTEASSEMKLDDDKQKIVPIRRHLPDDARLKVHILALTVRTLCNIQTNQHHPASGTRGLSYSIKYALKPEPHTITHIQSTCDDAVVAEFRGLSRPLAPNPIRKLFLTKFSNSYMHF